MGGTTSTHIANAYKGPVYAKADAERRYLTMEQYTANVGVEGYGSVGSGATRSWDWHKIQAGFVRINPGDYVRFDVDTSSSSTVYISVITEDGRLVANALPRREDLSVIVGANAQIYDTVHGKLWQDTHGHYHLGRAPHGRVKRAAKQVDTETGKWPTNGLDYKPIKWPTNPIDVPTPSLLGQSQRTTIGDQSIIAPVAAVAGVCILVLAAALVVMGLKKRRSGSKTSKKQRIGFDEDDNVCTDGGAALFTLPDISSSELHQTASNDDKTQDKQHVLSQAESAVTMSGYDAAEESCSSTSCTNNPPHRPHRTQPGRINPFVTVCS